MDKKVLNELKILALETINNAGSGHSGSVLSCADALYTLYTRHLVSNGTKDMLRDRFVLSNGHACAILYSIFAGLNYFDVNELKTFRKFGGKLTGHPEIEIEGVDANTGPLGQGVANAVGMAIAETVMNARFNLDHYTYCMAGDGCLQEGVALEALSIAGLYGLNKFILFYDKNDVTLDGKLNLSSTDNVSLKFKSMNFNVIEVDGHNIEKIDKAIIKAKTSKTKPTVIILKTKIGKDTELEGSNLSHGKVYTKDEITKLRNKYKINTEYLTLSNDSQLFLQGKKKEIDLKLEQRKNKFELYLKNNPQIKKKYSKFVDNSFSYKVKKDLLALATRQANSDVLNQISKTVDNLLVLSADLSSSTKVKINDGGLYSVNNRLGKNINVGIREHAMGAIANGIALHGGFRVITSTFLTFSNYMLPSIRMAAIMKLPVMFVFTHSSVYDTPDGITHIPVEQLDQLRLIPNIIVARPCDINECGTVYKWYFEKKQPMCVCLSRGVLPCFEPNENAVKGAYLMNEEKVDAYIMSSGSEVRIAVEVKEMLKDKLNLGVVSVPSLEIFEKQQKTYINKLTSRHIFVVESSTCVKYLKYTKESNIFNVKDFGETGDEKSLREKTGYTAEKISKEILKLIKKI